MTAYLIRRFIQMLIVLLLSSMAIYTLLNLAPGGPFDQLRQVQDKKQRISDERVEETLFNQLLDAGTEGAVKPEDVAREALRLAAVKLPVKTRTVVREDW